MAEKSAQSVHEQLKRWRRCDDIEGLRKRVYRALRIAEEIAYAEQTSSSERLKACTAIQQTARTYLKIMEADELIERIEQLEQLANESTSTWSANGH